MHLKIPVFLPSDRLPLEYSVSKGKYATQSYVQLFIPLKQLESESSTVAAKQVANYAEQMVKALDLGKAPRIECIILSPNVFSLDSTLEGALAVNSHRVLKSIAGPDTVKWFRDELFPVNPNLPDTPSPIYLTKETPSGSALDPDFSEETFSTQHTFQALKDSIKASNTQEVLALAAKIANVVSGGTNYLRYDEAENQLTWSYGSDGFLEDFNYASSASKTLLSMAVYLADHALRENPVKAIKLPPFWGVLDDLRRVRLTRVLEAFYQATGIGLYVVFVRDSHLQSFKYCFDMPHVKVNSR